MNFLLIGVLVSLAFAGLIFITSENIFSTISIFLITFIFLVFLIKRLLDKYQKKTRRYHQCYQFINSYLISLSIKGSLSAARESSYGTADKEVKEVMDSIKDLDEEEKLSYLCKYFKFDLYHLFLDTIKVWREQGGDILIMSQYLISQVRLKEEYLLHCESVHRSKLIEFFTLWGITLTILTSLRFALSQFYTRIIHALFFQVAVVVLFIFVLLSFYIMVTRITNVSLEGYKDDEK